MTTRGLLAAIMLTLRPPLFGAGAGVTRRGRPSPSQGEKSPCNIARSARFDPHFTAFGRDTSHLGMVFRGRYKLAKEDKLATELAAEPPKISSDGKAYTVKMPGPMRLAATDPSTSSWS